MIKFIECVLIISGYLQPLVTMFIGGAAIYISHMTFKNAKETRLHNEFLELNTLKRDAIKLISEMTADQTIAVNRVRELCNEAVLIDLDDQENYELLNAEAEKMLEDHVVVYDEAINNLESLISIIHESKCIDNVIIIIHNLEDMKLRNKNEHDTLYNEYKFKFKLRLQQFKVEKERKNLKRENNN